MHGYQVAAEKLFIPVCAVVVAILSHAAAAASGLPVRPSDTQEWGNEVVHLAAESPGTIAVGPGGATLQGGGSGSGFGTSSVPGRFGSATPADTATTADYCFEIDLTDGSSGPYRLRFYLSSSGGSTSSAAPHGERGRASHRRRGMRPQDDSASLAFDLATSADASALTTGDLGLIGTLYNSNDDLVASDDSSGDRISTSLPSGDYTLVLSGSDLLANAYTVVADSGTCADD
jgi:hypothetical protein